MTIERAESIERPKYTPRDIVAGWEASLLNAKANGNIMAIKLDELCLELAKKGLSISDLPNNDPRLVEIRNLEPRRKDSIEDAKPKKPKNPPAEVAERNDRMLALHQLGYSRDFIAKDVKRSVSTVSDVIHRYADKLGDQTDYASETIRGMYTGPASVPGIAKALGFTTRGVHKRLQRLAEEEKL